MHALLAFFGPKATLPIVLLIFLIAPVAVWHYVHAVVATVKWFREKESEEKPEE